MSQITVCGNCLRASCWQGIFYCDQYKNAGTIGMPISKLKEMALEDPSYWSEEDEDEKE